MAEALRSLGDLAAAELAGPMAGFLDDLIAEGRAVAIEIAWDAASRARSSA